MQVRSDQSSPAAPQFLELQLHEPPMPLPLQLPGSCHSSQASTPPLRRSCRFLGDNEPQHFFQSTARRLLFPELPRASLRIAELDDPGSATKGIPALAC